MRRKKSAQPHTAYTIDESFKENNVVSNSDSLATYPKSYAESGLSAVWPGVRVQLIS